MSAVFPLVTSSTSCNNFLGKHITSRIIQVGFKCSGIPMWLWKLPPNEGLLHPAVTKYSQSRSSTPAWILNEVFWNHLIAMLNMTLTSKTQLYWLNTNYKTNWTQDKDISKSVVQVRCYIFKELYKKGRQQLRQTIFFCKLLQQKGSGRGNRNILEQVSCEVLQKWLQPLFTFENIRK